MLVSSVVFWTICAVLIDIWYSLFRAHSTLNDRFFFKFEAPHQGEIPQNAVLDLVGQSFLVSTEHLLLVPPDYDQIHCLHSRLYDFPDIYNTVSVPEQQKKETKATFSWFLTCRILCLHNKHTQWDVALVTAPHDCIFSSVSQIPISTGEHHNWNLAVSNP